jgi:hypothetical protein
VHKSASKKLVLMALQIQKRISASFNLPKQVPVSTAFEVNITMMFVLVQK